MLHVTEVTDFQLIEAESYAVVSLQDHAEMDCDYGGEHECQSCEANRRHLVTLRTEMERRSELGISIPDPRVGMQALEPFGYEWQIEQNERTHNDR